jgi:hypothetical protein
MRKSLVVGLLLLLPFQAHGNPVDPFDPHYLVKEFPAAALFALTVESAVVALLLMKRGARLLVFGGYFLTNWVVYELLFSELILLNVVPVFQTELLVVFADCVFIKVLLEFKFFQGEDYEGVGWLRAVGISLIGNLSSFVAGVIGIIAFHG